MKLTKDEIYEMNWLLGMRIQEVRNRLYQLYEGDYKPLNKDYFIESFEKELKDLQNIKIKLEKEL